MFGIAFEGVESIAPGFFAGALIGLKCGTRYDLPSVNFLNQFGLGVTRHPQRGTGFIEPVNFAIEIVEAEENADDEEGNGENLQPAGERSP